ncbi:MAG: DUF3298 and DUF4163 domain-containing protein [Hyphomonas sp.]|uniref:DUF3298 and DUF4163 domain-containing protein n=1 Tax=Hyphomonas sp. TaxID=87 RepID=UPI0017BC1867|nr:DUF3298 domain-containing protein [Hyphomonas sp.]MBA3069408.1 DUF3298 and DUF4163 domain-containing protein [Hyphomonas sp.]MBU3920578.1 DUF3298 and DUF4163 domain-containing protein [Alphaproteobacteria bacterium]MBU4063790.1 DUF3298 and DUF4163 domain-containing protein [Alphaproteobacteria bacterium]MBU4164249.1 DUF3298 and DUF4163 domain-containing protein [Alphaproteobacteria bacterium]
MLRLLATASLAALILAACTPPPAEPAAGTDLAAAEDPAAEPASAETPPPAVQPEGFQLAYKLETENYEVSAGIDPAILAFDPPLAWKLWTDARAALDELGATADADRKQADAEQVSSGENWFRGYTLDITYRATAVFDDVISVSETYSTYTGGAHPNYALSGSVHRKGEAGALGLAAFVTDFAVFNEMVIQALVEEKLARGFEAAARDSVEAEIREMLAPSPERPELYKGNFVLEPSTEPGKAGGITVLFSPYDVGAYAEGSYEVTLSATDLLPILTETWSGRFGGEPVVVEQ